jgi:protease-4
VQQLPGGIPARNQAGHVADRSAFPTVRFQKGAAMNSDSQPEGVQEPLAPVELVDERRPRRPRKRSGGLRALLILLLVLGLGGSVLLNVGLLLGGGGFDSGRKVREKYFSHKRYARDKIAIISVDGLILEEDEGFVKRQIEQASEDDDVKAVVLRVDSPGGTVTGSDFLYHHLRKLREERQIPFVVSMGSVAASGGYYVAMAASDTPGSIFAEPTTWTGSIGVIIPHYDLSTLLNKWGVEDDSIASHPLKNMGSFAKPMTEEERQIFQSLVDESFKRFKDIVKAGRPKFSKDPDALDKLATGQVYTAYQALEHGLIDKIGFLEAAVDRAIELSGLDSDRVRVVKYRREPTLADVLMGARARHRSLEVADILEMSVPRAYYLCTRMPPLIHSSDY